MLLSYINPKNDIFYLDLTTNKFTGQFQDFYKKKIEFYKPIKDSSGNIINFGMYKTTNLFVNFTTFKITNGAVYYIYSEYYNWIHIQFDTINNKIYVYWQSGRTDQSAGVSLLFNISFYAFIRVMA